MDQIREGCAWVARRSRHVRIEEQSIPAYAAALPLEGSPRAAQDEAHLGTGSREQQSAFWLTLDAINFGSGWFPSLRKAGKSSGYFTIAGAVRSQFVHRGGWTAAELAEISADAVAEALGQDPALELMALFARSLRDLGRHVATDHGGRFASPVECAEGSAVKLVEELAAWDSFADTSSYDGVPIPFLKRAQIAAADLMRAGVADFADVRRLTMFADNLVPHVLRLDGVLAFEQELTDRIEVGELIEHGSAEEVEIRACALHAVELIVAARPESSAAQVDQLLWSRGQHRRYKAVPRHRSRCTAY